LGSRWVEFSLSVKAGRIVYQQGVWHIHDKKGFQEFNCLCDWFAFQKLSSEVAMKKKAKTILHIDKYYRVWHYTNKYIYYIFSVKVYSCERDLDHLLITQTIRESIIDWVQRWMIWNTNRHKIIIHLLIQLQFFLLGVVKHFCSRSKRLLEYVLVSYDCFVPLQEHVPRHLPGWFVYKESLVSEFER
jgi:hypothetical protein